MVKGGSEGESGRGQSRDRGGHECLSIITLRLEPHMTPRRNWWKLLHLDRLPPRVIDWQGFEKGSRLEPFGGFSAGAKTHAFFSFRISTGSNRAEFDPQSSLAINFALERLTPFPFIRLYAQ